jgi:membrane-associated HD superfamily phosphohydrolase
MIGASTPLLPRRWRSTLTRPPSLAADNIEQNVFHVTQDTRGAAEQLTQAHASQRRAGRRAMCLLMILLVVLSVVFVAVSSIQSVTARLGRRLLICALSHLQILS